LLTPCTETLKKQASQQGVEYNRLADAHNAAVSTPLVVIPWLDVMLISSDWQRLRQEGRLRGPSTDREKRKRMVAVIERRKEGLRANGAERERDENWKANDYDEDDGDDEAMLRFE
jgi:hypothetical protein